MLARIMQPGDWRPGGFPAPVNLAVTLTLLVIMGIRGADYAFGDSPTTARRLSEVEAAMPLWMWGTLFLTAASLGFIAIILRCAGGLIWSHILGWAAYWALSSGLAIDVYNRENDAGLFDVWVAGVLVVGVLVVLWTARNSEWPVLPLTSAAIMGCIAVSIATDDWDGLRNATVLAGIGMLHAVMAFGTASVVKQNRIRDRGESKC